jgi:cardiolipin synthase A/B
VTGPEPDGRRWGATLATAAAAAGLVGWATARHLRDSVVGFTMPSLPPVDDPGFGAVLTTLTAAPVREGCEVTVLHNGDEIFPAMLAALESAERTVELATYVWWRGAIARRFAHTLAARARAGVEVRVLLDAVGATRIDRDLVDLLTTAGVEVAWFRPPRWYTLHKLDHRSHRRILVVDDRVGFTGGVGIADEWTGDAQDPGHWRETHVRITGPAVRDLTAAFVESWAEATRTVLVRETAGDGPDDASADGDARVQVVRSAAAHGPVHAELLHWAAVRAARRRVWFTTAYFAPRPSFVTALCDAARSGVDVRLVVNGPHCDAETVRMAGRAAYAELLSAGVRIFEYQRTMLHAKVCTVDGLWASVGSANLDVRSFSLNDELNCTLVDPTAVATLDAHAEVDQGDADEITEERWAARSWTLRARERAAALVRQEL